MYVICIMFTLIHTFLSIITEIHSQTNSQSSSNVESHKGALVATDSTQPVDTNPYNLEVGSVVQYGSKCGVIKWMGNIPDQTGTCAGLEMVMHGNDDHFKCFI